MSRNTSDLQNRVAHFYRFQELDKGMKIVPDSQSPFHFSFDPSQPVSIDDIHYVTPIVDDPQAVTLDAGVPTHSFASRFDDGEDFVGSHLIRIQMFVTEHFSAC